MDDVEAACRRNAAQALSALMRQKAISKSKLSTDTGIARQTVDDILKQDRLVSTETLITLAMFFKTTPAAILGGQVGPAQPEPTALDALRAEFEKRLETMKNSLTDQILQTAQQSADGLASVEAEIATLRPARAKRKRPA